MSLIQWQWGQGEGNVQWWLCGLRWIHGLLPLSSRGGEGWSLDILEGPTWAKGLWFYQAAAAWTMVWQVAGALPVAKVIGLSASCLRKSVTKSRHEGRLAPRRHLGKGA